jgi:tetratricopeptide (TPR) repeat protein
MIPDSVMRMADEHHRAGRPVEAERLCREILCRERDHPGALHLSGLIAAQSGRLDAGVELIRRAVRVRPRFPQAWRNLGCVLVNHGKPHEAIEAYRRLIQLRPTDAPAHFAVGLLLRDTGGVDEAIAALSRAIELQPGFAEAHATLGQLLRNRERLDEAISAYSKAIALKPGSADPHNNLANVLRDKGMLDEAIAEYIKAIRLKDDDAVTCFNLGNALSQKESFAEAVVAYERAVQLNPHHYEALHQLGFALASLERFEDALRAHRRALDLKPDDPRGHEALGATLLLNHKMPAAEASFRRALELGSGSALVWNGLGTALKCLGRFDEASACFRKAMAINPDGAAFYNGLVATGRRVADAAELTRLDALLRQSGLPVDDRINAGFALAKLLDEADRFDDAFDHVAAANSLFKQTRAAAGDRFDADLVHRTIERMIEAFTSAFFADRRAWGDPSELPVFIVGMPRSGTTLVEQILASHPDVFGAGELQEIPHLSHSLPGPRDRATGHNWDAASIARASKSHLAHLRSLDGDAARVIDKLPGNVFHLGLIATMFPAARVIFCRRDPRDNCLSCYFQRFARNNLLFTYDLVDCARQSLETDRLIAHWLRALPIRMCDIQYEALVADQEGESRRLVEFLGLPWDAACLDFHRTERPVVTASVWQVRQPIYTRSVGRWRHYQRHLEPLLEVLDGVASTAGVGAGTAVG